MDFFGNNRNDEDRELDAFLDREEEEKDQEQEMTEEIKNEVTEKIEETEEQAEELAEEKKKPQRKASEVKELKRFPEIEEKVEDSLDRGDIESALMLNELTLARNLEMLSAREAKQFKIVFVAFKTDGKVVKRAGVYNEKLIENPEDAEDIVIGEDFNDNRVLAIPRNSVFAKKF